jgi:hypothetical protein
VRAGRHARHESPRVLVWLADQPRLCLFVVVVSVVGAILTISTL